MEPPPLLFAEPADYFLTHSLAEAFLAGAWDLDSLVERGSRVLGRRYRWLRPLSRRMLKAYSQQPRPRVARLAVFLSNDKPHVGRTIVLKMDLRDFFVSITSARVMAIYLAAGYPEPVARLLTGLCTNTVPLVVWNQAAAIALDPSRLPTGWLARRAYRQPHLPQGAPTSPALANLVAHRLDVRLAGLAAAAEANYTLYADDLVFSGGESFARSIARFPIHAAAIALEEGFAVQHRKTRVMRQGVRQRAAGVVINQKINIARDDYDRLKAILYNCVRYGPLEQNRVGVADFRSHLAGRVAHACRLNPGRGERLMRLFEGIEW